MVEKITIDMLSEHAVSIKTQRYVVHEGQEYAIGEPHRRAFINTEQGREEIGDALPDPYLSAVMAVWGGGANGSRGYEIKRHGALFFLIGVRIWRPYAGGRGGWTYTRHKRC